MSKKAIEKLQAVQTRIEECRAEVDEALRLSLNDWDLSSGGITRFSTAVGDLEKADESVGQTIEMLKKL